MVLSVIITTYWVLGIKLDGEKITPFSFSLPFTAFREISSEQYWKEVAQKIYQQAGADINCPIYVATQEEFLLSSDYFKNVSRISEILANNKLPLVYLGETRGSVQGVVTPFIINPTDFYRWFYLAENINSVENYFYNRRAYGVRKPDGAWEQGFEESLFREKLTYIFENTKTNFFESTKDLVLTGEGIKYAGDTKRLILSFLDSAKQGFWRVYTDVDTILLNLELIKIFDQDLYKKHAKNVELNDLAGCLVVPNATRLEIKSSTADSLNVNLSNDAISVIPFDKDDKVEIKVYFEKQSQFFEVSGGSLGLVVDNRTRPLLRDKSSKQRVSLIEKWTKEISSKVSIGKNELDEQQANQNSPINNDNSKDPKTPAIEKANSTFDGDKAVSGPKSPVVDKVSLVLSGKLLKEHFETDQDLTNGEIKKVSRDVSTSKKTLNNQVGENSNVEKEEKEEKEGKEGEEETNAQGTKTKKDTKLQSPATQNKSKQEDATIDPSTSINLLDSKPVLNKDEASKKQDVSLEKDADLESLIQKELSNPKIIETTKEQVIDEVLDSTSNKSDDNDKQVPKVRPGEKVI